MKNLIITKIKWVMAAVLFASLPLHLPAQQATSPQSGGYTAPALSDENSPTDGTKKKIEGTVNLKPKYLSYFKH